MQIIYINQLDQTVQRILERNLKPEQYTVQRIAYPDSVYSITFTGEISNSRLLRLRHPLHSYSVDDQRVRDWLGY
jgi:hypothetical protein